MLALYDSDDFVGKHRGRKHLKSGRARLIIGSETAAAAVQGWVW